jgi:hypothetical protein
VLGSYNSWYVAAWLFLLLTENVGLRPGDHGYVLPSVLDSPTRRAVCAGDTSLGRYNKIPRMRVQKAENVNKALEFITSRGVKLTNIGPEGNSWECLL